MRGTLPIYREVPDGQQLLTEGVQLPCLLPNGDPSENRLPQGIQMNLCIYGLPIEGTKLHAFVTAFADFCDTQGVILLKGALTGAE